METNVVDKTETPDVESFADIEADIDLSNILEKIPDSEREGIFEDYIYSERGWEFSHTLVDDCYIVSNPLFARGTGIVLVTDPRSIKRATGGPMPHGWAGLMFNPNMEVRHIQDKGCGVVAKRHFLPGEPLLVANPFFLVDERVLGITPVDVRNEIIMLALSKLPLRTRGTLDECVAKRAAEAGGSREVDIILTNAYCIPATSGTPCYFALYPLSSFFNHDCRPNVTYYINKGWAFNASTNRDIGIGEELCVSYVSLWEPSWIRRTTIRSWGFRCQCKLCGLPKELERRSDNRLARIRELWYRLESWKDVIDGDDKTVDYFISLCTKEGLTEVYTKWVLRLANKAYHLLALKAASGTHGSTAAVEGGQTQSSTGACADPQSTAVLQLQAEKKTAKISNGKRCKGYS